MGSWGITARESNLLKSLISAILTALLNFARRLIYLFLINVDANTADLSLMVGQENRSADSRKTRQTGLCSPGFNVAHTSASCKHFCSSHFNSA